MRHPRGVASCEDGTSGGGSAGGGEAPYVAGDGSGAMVSGIEDSVTASVAKLTEGMRAGTASMECPGDKVSNP
jgi:hypothetical protein